MGSGKSWILMGLLVCMAAVAARGAPPAGVRGNGPVGLAQLEARLQKRQADLAAREAFAKKPQIERLLLTYAEGARKFAGKRIDGRLVVREIFRKWAAKKKVAADFNAADQRLLKLLPEALRAHERVAVPAPDAAERAAVRRALVDGLGARAMPVRVAADACLRRLTGRTVGFDAAASISARKTKRKAWRKVLRS